MIRNAISMFALAAIAALSIVGCTGKEDLTDLSGTWTTREGEVKTKLMNFQNDYAAVQSQLATMTVSNPDDTTLAAKYASINQRANDLTSKVADVETRMATLSAQRDTLAAAGKRAEFESAWKVAETEYAAINNEVDALIADLSALKNDVAAMNTSATPSTMDTSAANLSAPAQVGQPATVDGKPATEATVAPADTAKK